MSLFVLDIRDSNPERAPSVYKICRWHIFSEGGAKSGTVSIAHGRQAGKMRKQLRPLRVTIKRDMPFGMSLLIFDIRDSNPERAPSVYKICRWHIFSEGGAKSGTVSMAHGRQAGKMRKQLRPLRVTKKEP